jgi:hypothetical protein
MLYICGGQNLNNMAIVSLKEFAESMGMPYDTAKKNAQRGNIIKGTDGKIDTENPTNRIFYNEKKASIELRPSKKVEKPTTKRSTEKPTTQTKEQKVYTDLDLRTKIATAQAKEYEAEIKRIEIEKKAGRLLPVELAEKAIVINCQAIFKAFDNEIDNMVNIITERFGGSRSDTVEIMRDVRVLLSQAVDTANKNATLDIENAVDEYSEVRSRGERK